MPDIEKKNRQYKPHNKHCNVYQSLAVYEKLGNSAFAKAY